MPAIIPSDATASEVRRAWSPTVVQLLRQDLYLELPVMVGSYIKTLPSLEAYECQAHSDSRDSQQEWPLMPEVLVLLWQKRNMDHLRIAQGTQYPQQRAGKDPRGCVDQRTDEQRNSRQAAQWCEPVCQ